jgi:hypothetical protein
MLPKYGFILALILCNSGVFAGLCYSSIRDPDSDDDEPITPTTSPWASCKNPKPAAGWACSDPSLTFPTVECIVADIKSCGNIGTGPTVFYSFGATTIQVRTGFRDKLTPPGVMFNDALGEEWWAEVIAGRQDFFISGTGARSDYFRNLFAVAMAQASSGEVFIVTKSRTGDAVPPGQPGAYQNPISSPNIWRDYEFPTLQINPGVTKVTSVDITNNYQTTTDWTPGDANPLLPQPVLNGPPAIPAKRKRDGTIDTSGACALDVSPTASSPADSTITPAPTMSCQLHNEDPDQGINQAYCICDSSITLSPLSVPPTGRQSDSCAYSTMPGTSAAEVVTTEAVTYTNNCQACTLIGGIADTPTCTSVSGCIPTQALAQVQAGSSPVHVGTLTGSALYTSISSALETLCPPVTQTTTSTQCESTGRVIRGISYIVDEGLETDGELTVRAEASAYNETSLRDAMIHSAALTAFQASIATKNCYNESYIVEELKRDVSPSRFNLLGRDRPYPVSEKIEYCNSVSFAAVQ